MTRNDPPSLLTPCVGVCRVDDSGYCEGCHRTLDEIAAWSTLDNAERARLMREVLSLRAVSGTPS